MKFIVVFDIFVIDMVSIFKIQLVFVKFYCYKVIYYFNMEEESGFSQMWYIWGVFEKIICIMDLYDIMWILKQWIELKNYVKLKVEFNIIQFVWK